MNQLKILRRREVDEQKWNALINSSVQSLPYAFSWYLDAVADNWDSVVLNNYEAAMPLVWLRKFGVKCLYQPYYCQQLGIFSRENLNAQQIKEFISVAQKFPYVNINLNSSAAIIAGEFKFSKKKNLLLHLNTEYTLLKKNYSENHRRNIAKAEKNKLKFSEGMELKQFQKFYLENINREKENFKTQHEKIFKTLTKTLIKNGIGKFFAVVNENGNPEAASVLLFHQNRIINIINTSSAEGKRNGSSHLLFDKIIEKFSDTENVFDFEGSSIVGIARFYEGFGAHEETFCNYHTTVIQKLKQRFL